MIITIADGETIKKVLQALSVGLKKVEGETPSGRKVVGYYVTDNQIRIDIMEAKVKK